MNSNQKYNPDCQLPEKCIHDNRWEHDKDRHLQAEHGITLATYRKLESEQGGKCGICDIPKEPGELRVDSFGGEVQGLLCVNCINRLNGIRAFVEMSLLDKAMKW